MSLENAPLMRLCAAVVIVLLSGLGVGARAADSGLTDAVTGAFETVVIDAAKAASKATAAAKDALAAEPRKRKRSKSATKKEDAKPEPETAKNGPGKSDEPAEKKAADKPPAKDAPGDKSADGKSGKAPAGKDAAEPAAKAADEAKTPDPKSDKADAKKPPAIPTEWPAVDVELAKARCTQLLKGIDAVTIPEAPFRKGDCGAMAPVRLISIGKNPEISFSPPPIVSCDLVVGLTKWLKDEVQPAAKKHLGSEVIRVDSMSDYSCRMAYGRVGNKLSEHGKANALDIGSFITRKGEEAVVLTDWGPNKRDIARQIAAAKAAAAKAAAASAAAEKESADRAQAAEVTAKSETTATKLPRKTLVEGIPPKKDSLAVPASVTKDGPADGTQALGVTENGKKDKTKKGRKDAGAKKSGDIVASLPGADAEVVAPQPKTPSSRFLHEIHASACRIFGTTLGPEANEAHRNHFHVDMAERKYKKICD
jgi:hypothetical protein